MSTTGPTLLNFQGYKQSMLRRHSRPQRCRTPL